ncbi:4-alpha-glucanotransferase, partial [Aquibium sp. A9E412]|nr:4-alpha-glucanotransferase [Aquibium sp. A9E412]
VADTPSLLAGARLADMAGEALPTNLPGTSDGYPNWRRRLAVPLEGLAETPLFAGIADVMATRRPRR